MPVYDFMGTPYLSPVIYWYYDRNNVIDKVKFRSDGDHRSHTDITYVFAWIKHLNYDILFENVTDYTYTVSLTKHFNYETAYLNVHRTPNIHIISVFSHMI